MGGCGGGFEEEVELIKEKQQREPGSTRVSQGGDNKPKWFRVRGG